MVKFWTRQTRLGKWNVTIIHHGHPRSRRRRRRSFWNPPKHNALERWQISIHQVKNKNEKNKKMKKREKFVMLTSDKPVAFWMRPAGSAFSRNDPSFWIRGESEAGLTVSRSVNISIGAIGRWHLISYGYSCPSL